MAISRNGQKRFWFRFFSWLANFLCWFEELKPRRPYVHWLLKAFITVIIGSVIMWFWSGHPLKFNSEPAEVKAVGTFGLAKMYGGKLTVSLICGFLVDIVVAQGLTPLGKYGRLAFEFNSIGLIKVVDGDGAFSKLVREYSELHTASKTVRVICISGKHLFQLGGTTEVGVAPLKKWADQGKLEVVMPISDVNNLTLKNRYSTYCEEFKREHNYETIEKLLEESDAGKKFLLARGNKVFEHNMFCMWRVVLFSEHCIIQNYFPNVRGVHSYLAPAFVYLRDDGCSGNYYKTFEMMFNVIKEHAAAIKANIEILPATEQGIKS